MSHMPLQLAKESSVSFKPTTGVYARNIWNDKTGFIGSGVGEG
jgi:hypothetical protein